MPTIAKDLNRALGYPRVKVRWWRTLMSRRFLSWYRGSRLFRATGSGMLSPVEAVFRHLELRKLRPDPVIALDVFGGTGLFKTVDLSPRCEHLTHMEIEPSLSHHARKVLPGDKTVFLLEDSIRAIREDRLPRKDYTLIHIDNVWGCFGPGYCENFDLFPSVVERLGPSGVLIFNLWLDIRHKDPDPAWLERRREFFGLQSPEDALLVDLDVAKQAYLARIPRDRFTVRDSFPVPHEGDTIYMVVCLERRDATPTASASGEAVEADQVAGQTASSSTAAPEPR